MAEEKATQQSFAAEVGRLVELFQRNLAHFYGKEYDEASLRSEFLTPFFRALGWDLENKAGLIPSHREVETESRTEISGRQKRADFLFRVEQRDRFVCEAKRPGNALSTSAAFQAKRYAWNKSLPLALLTDFASWRLYVVGSKPHPDEPDMGLWKSWTCQDLLLNADEIWHLLSRDSVAGGVIEQEIDALPKKAVGKGKARQQWLIKPDRSRSLDVDFLNFLDEARRELASDLLKHNDRADLLEGTKLNEAVQRIIDRILFLRICEDREIDTGKYLKTFLRGGRDEGAWGKPRQPALLISDPPGVYKAGAKSTAPEPEGAIWRSLARHFGELDRRPPTQVPFFNGNLFKKHFCEELTVGDAWLSDFISELSDEESPYLFVYIPVEILGTIYERFLGKVVRPHGRGAVIEEKPEVRKAGGVYYTPRYIVDYIVEQTVGKLLDGKSAEQSLALKILDPACGSGSFLIRAFEKVCEHWQAWLMANPKKARREWCWTDPKTNDLHLTSALKRRILTNTIFGVDLDSAAVEVTQLSLYLKMLEDENRTTLQRERELFGTDDPILPPLQDNIKCGNSLVASDFSMLPDDIIRVHAFDWEDGFKTIMKAGGFDAVIGNPPYIRIQGFPPDQVAYFGAVYKAATGNYDIYVNFVERGKDLLSSQGRLGMILPNKFFRTDYGVGLRRQLARENAVTRIVDFGSEQVFDATTYTCLLFLSREQNKSFDVAESKANPKAITELRFESRDAAQLTDQAWTFADARETSLLAKMHSAGTRLLDLPSEMSRGSSSGDDEVFVVENGAQRLEPGALRVPLFATDFGRYFFEPSTRWRIIYPYVNEKKGVRLLRESEFRRKYPKTLTYLLQNISKLQVRKQYTEWFGYSAPRNLVLHDQAQIAIPLLANTPCFSLIPKSSRGKLCPMASGGFTITVRPHCHLAPEFVLGLLNSKLLFWCLRQKSNVFRGGWITCTKQYFGELPIISLDLTKPADRSSHDRVVGLVEKIMVFMPRLYAADSESEKATLQNAVDATDREIDQLVYELYGLTQDEIALVEAGA